ncbi:MAG TPA: alpha/beta hydrolase [Nocardioides sp.]|jgi:pimeloyl-ACP methyl ester carboxylesterase|nr:alpha/beta hydrolase [Nocardioides sp.]
MTDPKRVQANGIDIAYLEAGPDDGPLALCLHGFPDHAPTWQHLMPELAAAGYHVVAPWLRGYSPTGLAPDDNYQVAAVALDALALADELGGDRDAVLIGHDWGAIAAYTAVGHRPERFSKLVTMAVPHQAALMARFLSTPAQLKRSWYIFFFQTPLAELIVPGDDFAVIDMLWRDWSPGLVPDPGFMRDLKATLGAPGSTAAAISYYRSMLGTKPGDPALDAIQAAGNGPTPVPTLYLHGADDGCMGVELVVEDEMQPFFPAGLDIEIVPASGHFLHLDQPEAVNRLVLDFLLSEISPARPS